MKKFLLVVSSLAMVFVLSMTVCANTAVNPPGAMWINANQDEIVLPLVLTSNMNVVSTAGISELSPQNSSFENAVMLSDDVMNQTLEPVMQRDLNREQNDVNFSSLSLTSMILTAKMQATEAQWRSSSSFSITSSNNSDATGNKMQVRGAENLILPMFASSMSLSGNLMNCHAVMPDALLSPSGESLSLNITVLTATDAA
jgi:hypothetical protein